MSILILFMLIHWPKKRDSGIHANGHVDSTSAGILSWDVDSFYDLSIGNLGEVTTKCQ